MVFLFYNILEVYTNFETTSATMKKEMIHRTHYETKESVQTAVFDYMGIQHFFGQFAKQRLLEAPGSNVLAIA